MSIQIADINAGRCRLRISGADCVAFLHGQCTNDIKRLETGQDCYAAFLNARGKMRGDAFIARRTNDFLLEASAGLAESLERFVITEDVLIEDVSASWSASVVVGGVPICLPHGSVCFHHPLGTGVLSPSPWPSTMTAEHWDQVRIEAGIPVYGVDMDQETIPVEAGLVSRAISYDKGCYIGQETIARIKTYGHVNRHLVVMAVEDVVVPDRGAPLTFEQRDVGRVTSATHSNRLGKPVALGYVRREFAQTGARVFVRQHPAEIINVCGT